MPRADDFCPIEIESAPVPTKLNPLGAKGAGEAGTVGALPAVMLAVLDALQPLGVTALDMPATPERVWQAIQAGEEVSAIRYASLRRIASAPHRTIRPTAHSRLAPRFIAKSD